MSKKIIKKTLPFSIPMSEEERKFDKDCERAAVFCLAELEKEKSRRFPIRQATEKLVCLTEVYYPLWLVSFRSKSLLFDGLITQSHVLTYFSLPDIQGFLDNLQTIKNRQVYLIFLIDNRNYFRPSNVEKRKKIEGLITDSNFLKDFAWYLTWPVKNISSERVTVSPSLTFSLVAETKRDLQRLRTQFTRDVKALYSCMKAINAKTEQFKQDLQRKILQVNREFNGKIKRVAAMVEEEIKTIHENYNKQVQEYLQKVEENSFKMEHKKVTLEKMKEKITKVIKQCNEKIKNTAASGDKIAEQKWKEEKERNQKELAQIVRELKKTLQQIKTFEGEKKQRLLELKETKRRMIKQATEKLINVEAARDAKIKLYRETQEQYEELTSEITLQIDKLIKMREKNILQLDELGKLQKQAETMLIYIPFYMACYQSERGKRYAIFPPSLINRLGVLVKLRKLFGKVAVKQLLQPCSRRILFLLNKFLLVMEQNPLFKREMDEACAKMNSLRMEKPQRSIIRGIEKLARERWLSKKEQTIFVNALKQI